MGGEHAGALGVGAAVAFGGREYALRRPPMLVRGRFEAWAERRARRQLEAVKDSIQPEEYAERLSRLEDKIHAGHFDYGEQGCALAARTGAGFAELLYLTFQHSHPDFGRGTLEKMFEDDAARKAVLDAWKAVTAGPNVPNPPAPDTAPAGSV